MQVDGLGFGSGSGFVGVVGADLQVLHAEQQGQYVAHPFEQVLCVECVQLGVEGSEHVLQHVLVPPQPSEQL